MKEREGDWRTLRLFFLKSKFRVFWRSYSRSYQFSANSSLSYRNKYNLQLLGIRIYTANQSGEPIITKRRALFTLDWERVKIARSRSRGWAIDIWTKVSAWLMSAQLLSFWYLLVRNVVFIIYFYLASIHHLTNLEAELILLSSPDVQTFVVASQLPEPRIQVATHPSLRTA